jgi:hypothetical protein
MMTAQRHEPAKSATTSAAAARKPWKKKTPVEIVFDQITKLKREIVDDEKTLAEKKRQLAKFEEAKKLFES